MTADDLCPICRESVNMHGVGWLREITGWEEVRSQGGANKIVNRQTTGRVMHRSCVGIDAKQGALFGSE